MQILAQRNFPHGPSGRCVDAGVPYGQIKRTVIDRARLREGLQAAVRRSPAGFAHPAEATGQFAHKSQRTIEAFQYRCAPVLPLERA